MVLVEATPEIRGGKAGGGVGMLVPRLELAALLLLIGASWFPTKLPLLTLLILPLVPISWILRLRVTGRLSGQSGMEAPLIYLLAATCVATAALVDAQLGLPKILGMAAGAAILVNIENWVTTVRAVRRAGNVVIGANILLVGTGLVATEWTIDKFEGVRALVDHFPALIRGVVPNTPQGGINPNELAGALVILIPVSVAQIDVPTWRRRQLSWRTLLALFVCAANLLLLFATSSRGALAAQIFVLTIWGVAATARGLPRMVRRERLMAAIALIAVIFVEAWIVLQFATASATVGQAANAAETLQGRVEIWDRSLAMVRDFPITGIGPGQFNPVFHLLYAPRVFAPDEYAPHAHSLLLAYAVELGVPGAAAFCVLLYAFMRCCIRSMRSTDAYVRRMGTAVALGIVAFLGFGLTDAIAPGARGGIAMWTILGLGGALSHIAVQRSAGALERTQNDGSHLP